ncbi:MAG: ACT domain-containing protein [Oceanicoccus sp.]
MTTSIVFTFVGADKPGLVEILSNTVSEYHGNWLESRMSHLAGNFAGIARIGISRDKAEDLKNALNKASGGELTITVQEESQRGADSNYQTVSLNLIGNDRPGIIKELSSALASLHVNVMEMNTNVTSAPMTADPLFEATASIQIPVSVNINDLSDMLDDIGNQLDVDINLET